MEILFICMIHHGISRHIVKTILGWCMLEPMLHVNSIFNYTFECNSQLPSAALVRILYWLEPLHHRLQLSLASTSRIWCIVFLGYGSSKLSLSIAPAVTRSQPVNKQYEWTELMTSCISVRILSTVSSDRCSPRWYSIIGSMLNLSDHPPIYSYISALSALDKDVYSAADILKSRQWQPRFSCSLLLIRIGDFQM